MAAEPAELHATRLLWLLVPGLRFQQDPWTAEIWSLISGPLDPNGTHLNSAELSGPWLVGSISQLRRRHLPPALPGSVSEEAPGSEGWGVGLSQGCACL